ncbi:MAG TPA: lysophospholipid acyltransferase family protein [Gaiellaceae bacterium]|nr:lysophospholipid acyltransferase family protein [Gaiellaceae bacterium]
MARPPRPSLLQLVIGLLSWPLVKGLFRHRSFGREHLPREEGFVLAANHLSNLDPWALGIDLFPRRYLRFMGKAELFWFPLGPIIRAAGAFPVRRGEHDEQAIATAIDVCRRGHVLLMFPEGTRRRKGLFKKHRPRWHTGTARIALAAGVPLVPAAVAGTDRLLRLGPLRAAYGRPLELSDLAGLPSVEAARLATDRLREAITELERSLA